MLDLTKLLRRILLALAVLALGTSLAAAMDHVTLRRDGQAPLRGRTDNLAGPGRWTVILARDGVIWRVLG